MVASHSGDPWFQSSQWQFLNYCQLYWKDENKEKEAWIGPFFKKSTPFKIVQKSLKLHVLALIIGRIFAASNPSLTLLQGLPKEFQVVFW